MRLDERIRQRFSELQTTSNRAGQEWHKWSTSVLNLLENAGLQTHLQNFRRIYDFVFPQQVITTSQLNAALGVFHAAKEDYEGGHVFSLEKAVSGEVFGDFVLLAKQSLAEGHKDVAAVLACAALEDALKRYARANDHDLDDKDMQTVVNALKSKGLVSGAQSKFLEGMPKIRDWAMHANWDKITPESVAGVIGFVERFLLERF
jgi:hypothetical protein